MLTAGTDAARRQQAVIVLTTAGDDPDRKAPLPPQGLPDGLSPLQHVEPLPFRPVPLGLVVHGQGDGGRKGLDVLTIPQNMLTLSPAMKKLERLLRAREMLHEHNPLQGVFSLSLIGSSLPNVA